MKTEKFQLEMNQFPHLADCLDLFLIVVAVGCFQQCSFDGIIPPWII